MKNSSLEVMETTRPIIGPDVEEGLIEFDGQDFYCIPDVGRIPPFLMSIISDGDRWMFLSSSGGLTAGRQTSEHALFLRNGRPTTRGRKKSWADHFGTSRWHRRNLETISLRGGC